MSKDNSPKVTISGRVDPRSLAIVAAFLNESGGVFSRSDLISSVVEIVAGIARKTVDLDDPDQYEDAFNTLERLGLHWEGKRSHRQRFKALQEDALSDLEPDQIEELTAVLTKLRKQNKGRKRQAKLLSTKSTLLKELEAIEEEENR